MKATLLLSVTLAACVSARMYWGTTGRGHWGSTVKPFWGVTTKINPLDPPRSKNPREYNELPEDSPAHPNQGSVGSHRICKRL